MHPKITVFIDPLGGTGGPPRSLAHFAELCPGPIHVFAAPGYCSERMNGRGTPCTLLPVHRAARARRQTLLRIARSPAIRGRKVLWVINGLSGLWPLAPLIRLRGETVLLLFRDSAPIAPNAARALRWLVRSGLDLHGSAPSELALDLLQKAVSLRSATLISNAIELPEQPRPLRWPLQTLGWIGSRKPVKGLDHLMHVLASEGGQLPCRIYGVRGTHPYIQACKDLAAELGVAHRLEWCGRQPESTIFAEIDLLISTSERESFGRAVMTAAGNGIPVLVPAVGALPTVFGDDWVYERADVAGAGARLRHLQEDRNAAEALRSHGLERAAIYGPTAVGGSIRALIEALS